MPLDPSILDRKPSQRTPEFLPGPGAYVFFTIDPLASVEALVDPEADKEARVLSPKTYVGYVGHYHGLPTPDLRCNKCGIVLLSRGLPEADETRGIEESMCVAVGLSEHPTGRAPMLPNPPLPWSNVYHHIYGSIVVRIGSCEGTNSETCPQISDADIVGTSSALNKDNRRIVDLMLRNRGAESTPATKPPLPPLFSEQSNEINAAADADSDSDDDEEEEGEEKGEGLPFEVMEIVERCLLGVEDEKDKFVPVARYSTDWKTVREFSDAKHVHEEIQAINRIIAESQERRRAEEREQETKADCLHSEQRLIDDIALNEGAEVNIPPVRRGPPRRAKTVAQALRTETAKAKEAASKKTHVSHKKAPKPTEQLRKRRMDGSIQSSLQDPRPRKARRLT
ncbi:hypothetical protein FA95DRAFT_1682777 [Auriscalpium vulgare]|uniref:Uncharacterized protein n=1 Tax=Auriscalpium vulgare TaxID=40419 RepID=A0ACB8RD83_9AGAM|nr:hypothetical protein FA95DRAFT_1682777 [Auriscalpium vulgare]